MITLLHGENIVASREELITRRKAFQGEVIIFDGKSVKMDKLQLATESLSLFGGDRLVIIENLFSRLSKKELNVFLTYLTDLKNGQNIIIWENKELTKVTLKKFTSWEIKSFPVPKLMFTFLESLNPQHKNDMLNLLKKLRKNSDDGFIYLMIVRQIRLLLLAKDHGLTGMPSWIAGKLYHQAENFTKEQLIDFYKKLLLIDIHQKTGLNSYLLKEDLDLSLLTL